MASNQTNVTITFNLSLNNGDDTKHTDLYRIFQDFAEDCLRGLLPNEGRVVDTYGRDAGTFTYCEGNGGENNQPTLQNFIAYAAAVFGESKEKITVMALSPSLMSLIKHPITNRAVIWPQSANALNTWAKSKQPEPTPPAGSPKGEDEGFDAPKGKTEVVSLRQAAIHDWSDAIAYAARNPEVTVERTRESIANLIAFALSDEQ